jgi:hypothetical protein
MKTLLTTLAVLSVAVTVIPLDTIGRRWVRVRSRGRQRIRASRLWLGAQVQQVGRWIQGREGLAQAAGRHTEPEGFSSRGAVAAGPMAFHTTPVAGVQPSRPVCLPVRLHVDPVDHRHAVIAGSMADVCAMLDRLVAADEPVGGVPAL